MCVQVLKEMCVYFISRTWLYGTFLASRRALKYTRSQSESLQLKIIFRLSKNHLLEKVKIEINSERTLMGLLAHRTEESKKSKLCFYVPVWKQEWGCGEVAGRGEGSVQQSPLFSKYCTELSIRNWATILFSSRKQNFGNVRVNEGFRSNLVAKKYPK